MVPFGIRFAKIKIAMWDLKRIQSLDWLRIRKAPAVRLLVCALLSSISTISSFAQKLTTPPNAHVLPGVPANTLPNASGSGRSIGPATERSDKSVTPKADQSAENPIVLPARPAMPILRELEKQFRQGRDTFLKTRSAARKEMEDRLHSATASERDAIIAESRERQRALVEAQKNLREEVQQRLQNLRHEFKNRERDQLLDEIKANVQGVKDRLRVGQD